MTTHYLYRLFDGRGDLLYVGRTVDVAQRFAHHKTYAPWWSDVAVDTVQPYPSLGAADAAETVAIQTENPQHNVRKAGASDYPPISRRVERRRGEAGLTVRALAREAGIPVTTLVRRLHSGNFFVDELAAIAGVLDTTLVDLVDTEATA